MPTALGVLARKRTSVRLCDLTNHMIKTTNAFPSVAMMMCYIMILNYGNTARIQ
jgi:ABC-type proline/glycine betaine transport system permease subunit